MLALSAASIADPPVESVAALHRAWDADRVVYRYEWPDEIPVSNLLTDLDPTGSYLVASGFMLNVQRTAFGRALAAVREKDYAAEVIGVDTFRYKLLAFWTSSFIGGVVGAVLVVSYLRSVSPDQFHIELSVQIVAMVIVGGLGSVLGSFFGAALILFTPIVLNNLVGATASGLGIALSADLRAHIPLMLYGALIVGFLVFEPLGLAKIYDNVRNYFLVWPFRHARR